MNFFSHAFRFIDGDPHFLVGTAIPDWLGMVDRRTRVRRAAAERLSEDADPTTRAMAQGIVQHHVDDDWFHQTRAFAELHLAFTGQIGELLAGDTRFRPFFVAHIVIEMLIDAGLTEANSGRLDRYYQRVAEVDPHRVESVVNRIAPRSTDRLAAFVPRFVREAFLYDYHRDEGVAYRVNRILGAIGLNSLPPDFRHWVGLARIAVKNSMDALLCPPADQPRFELGVRVGNQAGGGGCEKVQ